MSKVLISFLGTSVADASANGYRQYRTAKYQFPDGDVQESSFIAFALKKHYGIDKVILVGTPKSMWEEVYASANGGRVDDAYIEIGEYCSNATAQTPLTPLPHQELIEESLGAGSKIILVHYGVNEQEMDLNAQLIFSIEQYLNSNDELYLDITHSFRSLPLHLMNALVYLKNVSSKRLDIKSISYGMLDIVREFGYAPVVELNPVLTMGDWVSAASDFMKAGNAYQVVELLKKSGNAKDLEIAKKLTRFSDLVNLNHIAGVIELVEDLKSIDKILKEASVHAQLVVRPVVKKFLSTFKNAESVAQKQFCFAEYQNYLCHYASSYICLAEAIVSWVCEKNGLDVDAKQARDVAKGLILFNRNKSQFSKLKPEEQKMALSFQNHYTPDQMNNLKQIFGTINQNRKEVAHSLGEGNHANSMIANLRIALEKIKPLVFGNV